MKTATIDLWRQRVEAWEASGETCDAYASSADLNPRTLSWWKWRLGKLAKGGIAGAGGREVSLIEVTHEVAAALDEGVIELDVGEVTIRVRGRVERDALVAVLDALEGRR